MSEKTISINRHNYSFTDGETILTVARRNGIFIPTLCHLAGTTPTGACRMCVVEVENARNLLASCTTPAADKMVVQTESPKVVRVRKTIIEFLMLSGNHNCAVRGCNPEDWSSFQEEVNKYDQSDAICEKYGDCLLQKYAYKYQVNYLRFSGFKPHYPMEQVNSLIMRDFSRCIQCGRCVQACNEVAVNNAISLGYRGGESKVSAMGDKPLEESDCVFCGECLRSCPVGALVDNRSRSATRFWDEKITSTTCSYCSLGCQVNLHVKDGNIMRTSADEKAEPNHGQLCYRGAFAFNYVKSTARITSPMLNENGTLKEISWEKALDIAAEKIKSIKDPNAIACITSPKHTNEDLYNLQKFFRAVAGTDNITQSEKITIPGTFMEGSINDIEQSECIVVLNLDLSNTHPILASAVKRAAFKGKALVVINKEITRLGKKAGIQLIPAPGTESVLLNVLIQQLSENPEEGGYTKDKAVGAAGIKIKDLEKAVELIKGKSISILYNPSEISAECELETLKKLSDKLFGIPGCNNTRGALDMGLAPGMLPGYLALNNEDNRKKYNAAWNCILSEKKGLDFNGIQEAVSKGEIKLLYCVGESPAVPYAKEDLFVITQDIFINEKNKDADLILPAASWPEYEGTYTNAEGRVSRVKKCVESPGNARPHWRIFKDLAAKMGQKWISASADEIWNREISQEISFLKDFSYSELKKSGNIRKADKPLANIIINGYACADYHHRSMVEKCAGLEAMLKTGDKDKASRDFDTFLKEEKFEDKKDEIDSILKRYRVKPGGLIPVLQAVQNIIGYLPIVVQSYIAQGLNLPPSDVYGVVTFYAFFTMVPRGKYTIKVCMGTACFVLGAEKIVEKFTETLNLKVGATSDDRLFSLETVRCLGACGLAPIVMINQDTIGAVSPSDVSGIIEKYKGCVHETK